MCAILWVSFSDPSNGILFKKLTPTEHNYDIGDHKLLVFKLALVE